MIKYTCKKCCNIMRNYSVCPICGKEDQVVPIEIIIQNGVKTLGLREQ